MIANNRSVDYIQFSMCSRPAGDVDLKLPSTSRRSAEAGTGRAAAPRWRER